MPEEKTEEKTTARSVDPNKARPVRVYQALWDAFGRAAGEGKRAEVLVSFMEWYVRKPRARQPQRPDVSYWTEPDTE